MTGNKIILILAFVSLFSIIGILLLLQLTSFQKIKKINKIYLTLAFEIQQLKEEVYHIPIRYRSFIEINYGVLNNYIDVTNICYSKLIINNILTIPAGDGNRANIFGDPLHGTLKSIFIVNNTITTEYKDNINIKINILNNNII